ncbi:hypothetical protein [Comamonas thiooxydans]|uniref:hypothetical protein n=1 Tax=Comamonas thiooxydans TaxID=363952 RepID=UPI00050E2539|nr:hypothetical protein [Comamonas thiooxydans]KGH23614.1 hypothetical protein P606_11905 [Comamonas thiooxydans]
MTTDEYFESLPANERPVFNLQSGGFVIPAHPELGSFKSGYRPATQALANARGIALKVSITPEKRAEMFDVIYRNTHRDYKGFTAEGEKSILAWAAHGGGLETAQTMTDKHLTARYQDVVKSRARKST